jgi:hypothetical protein
MRRNEALVISEHQPKRNKPLVVDEHADNDDNVNGLPIPELQINNDFVLDDVEADDAAGFAYDCDLIDAPECRTKRQRE